MNLGTRLIRYYTTDRIFGLALTVLAVLLGHYTRQYTGVLYTAPFYVVLVIVSDIAGLRMGFLAATLFSIGAYLQWFGSNGTLFWINAISLYSVAWIVGGLKRKARIIDTLNGNLDLLWHIVREVDYLILHWHTLSDKTKYLRVTEIKSAAVDLTTNVLGWKKMAELQEQNKLVTRKLDDYAPDNNQESDTSTQEV